MTTGMTIRQCKSFEHWALAVQHNSKLVKEAVEIILDKHKDNIEVLANAPDDRGRLCKDIAQSDSKRAIFRRLNLHGRYELQSGAPLHESVTSLVIKAVDHGELGWDNDPLDAVSSVEATGHGHVVLKFMRYRDHFLREVSTRVKGNFDKKYVLPVLKWYDGDSDSPDDVAFFHDAESKGYEEYHYCVVMEAATCNLKQVIDQQLIAANDWVQLKQLSLQLTQCLAHLHDKGVVHGDLKRAYVRNPPVLRV